MSQAFVTLLQFTSMEMGVRQEIVREKASQFLFQQEQALGK